MQLQLQSYVVGRLRQLVAEAHTPNPLQTPKGKNRMASDPVNVEAMRNKLCHPAPCSQSRCREQCCLTIRRRRHANVAVHHFAAK